MKVSKALSPMDLVSTQQQSLNQNLCELICLVALLNIFCNREGSHHILELIFEPLQNMMTSFLLQPNNEIIQSLVHMK